MENEDRQQRLPQLQSPGEDLVAAESAIARQQLVFQTQLATLGRFSVHVAHELRNPLGVIRNAVFFLKRKVPPDQPKWHEYLDMIERETVATDKMISAWVALTRISPPEKKPAALGTLIAAAREQLSAPETVEWRVIGRPDPLLLSVDAAQFEQVLKHLFSNAIAAMGNAGTITVEAGESSSHVDIFVSDSGPGVAADIRGQIFEPLFTTNRKAAGLGLAACRHIVGQHGGSIELADSPQGARFHIRLPK
jgi:signal transduction histidine kinase